jgi:hypothetical protein
MNGNEQDEQLWLDPEWKKEHDRIVWHQIGKKVSEADVYKVPGISIDEDAREMMRNWPVEVTARGITILRPFALVAELEPRVLFDFRTSPAKKVLLSKHDHQTVKIEFKILFQKKF